MRAFTYLKAMFLLAKHWLSLTVAFSAVVGWLLFLPELSIRLFFVFIGTFFLAGGAAALNQYQERNLDLLMSRTRWRPIPSGLVSGSQALMFAIVLIFAGVFLFLAVGLYKTLILGLINIVIYNLIYTNLKTKTQFAVLPGALVGAIPPMMGWVASGGQIFDLRLFYFAIFMFLWQMPHFWLMMANNAIDYQKAGFKVISNQLEQVKVNRLVFFWAVITGLYLLAMPVFFSKTPFFILGLIIALNIIFIFAFYSEVFRPKMYSTANSKAFILINAYVLIAMVLMVASSFFSA